MAWPDIMSRHLNHSEKNTNNHESSSLPVANGDRKSTVVSGTHEHMLVEKRLNNTAGFHKHPSMAWQHLENNALNGFVDSCRNRGLSHDRAATLLLTAFHALAKSGHGT